MKIIFLGTNGWYDTETGNTICTLIDAKEGYIILDAGNGIYKVDQYIKGKKPVYLFLSHFHIDHIEGLHILDKFKFDKLTILGQQGTLKTLEGFLNEKFSVPLNKLPYKTEVIELKEGRYDNPVKFKCLKLKHASPCFGFRFELEGKIISYCIDTGFCNEAVELSKNADLLISECTYTSGQQRADWPHLNPELAAELAIDSKAKKLVITHFDAEAHRTMKIRNESEKKAKEIFPNTLAAKDKLRISL